MRSSGLLVASVIPALLLAACDSDKAEHEKSNPASVVPVEMQDGGKSGPVRTPAVKNKIVNAFSFDYSGEVVQ